MNYQFDSATGFLVTKALQKLQGTQPKQEVKIDASQKNSNNVINNYKTPKESNKKPKIINDTPKPKSNIITAKNNTSNVYYIGKAASGANRVADKIGGETYQALSELASGLSMLKAVAKTAFLPFKMAGMAAKGGIDSYLRKRDDKADEKAYADDQKEQEAQTGKLDEIVKELKKGRGSGGGIGSFLKGGMGRIAGGLLGGAALSKLIKSRLAKLALPALIMSQFDNYQKELERIASEQGISVDSLGITDRFQAITNMIGGGIIDVLNMFGAEINPSSMQELTKSIREVINQKFENFKASYPRFGEAVGSVFEFTDDLIGKGANFVESGLKKLKDHAEEAFRDKDDKEKAFLAAKSKREEAQDVVKMTGDGKILGVQVVSDEEIAKRKAALEAAKADESRVAQDMLKAGGTMSAKTESEAVMAANRPTVEANTANAKKFQQDSKKANELMDKATSLNTAIEGSNKTISLLQEQIALKDDKESKYVDALEQAKKTQDDLRMQLEETTKALEAIEIFQPEKLPYEISDRFSGDGAKTVHGTVNEITGKQGGSKAWRNNNPGNITGMDGKLRYGAKGIAYSKTGDKGDQAQLVFETEQDGWNAMRQIMEQNYSNNPINSNFEGGSGNRTFYEYQTDKNAFRGKLTDLQKHGIDTNKRFSELSDSEKQTFMKVWAKHEGWREGTKIGRSEGVSVASANTSVSVNNNAKSVPVTKSVIDQSQIASVNNQQARAKQPLNNQQPQTVTIDTEKLEQSFGNTMSMVASIMGKHTKAMSSEIKTAMNTGDKASETITVNIENRSTGGMIGSQV